MTSIRNSKTKIASILLAMLLVLLLLVPALAATNPGTHDLYITLTIDTDPKYELKSFASATNVRFYTDQTQDIVSISNSYSYMDNSINGHLSAKQPGSISLDIQEGTSDGVGGLLWNTIGFALITVVNPVLIVDEEIDLPIRTYLSFPEYKNTEVYLQEIGYPKILSYHDMFMLGSIRSEISVESFGSTYVQIRQKDSPTNADYNTWPIIKTLKINIGPCKRTPTVEITLKKNEYYILPEYSNKDYIINDAINEKRYDSVVYIGSDRIQGQRVGSTILTVQEYEVSSTGVRYFNTVDIIKVTVIDEFFSTPTPTPTPTFGNVHTDPPVIDRNDSSSSDSSSVVGPTSMNITAYGPSAQSMYAGSTMTIDPSYLTLPGEITRIVDNSENGIVTIDGHTITGTHRGYTDVTLEVYDPKYDRWVPLTVIQITVLSGDFAPPAT